MKKMILALLSLLVIGLFLVGCNKEGSSGEAVKIQKTETPKNLKIDCNPCNSVYSQCRHILSLEEGANADISGDNSYQITMNKVDSKTADLSMTGMDIDESFGSTLKLGKLEKFGYKGSQIILLSTEPANGGKPLAKICIINQAE